MVTATVRTLTKSWWRLLDVRSHEFNLTTMNHWFRELSCYQKKAIKKEQALEYSFNGAIYFSWERCWGSV